MLAGLGNLLSAESAYLGRALYVSAPIALSDAVAKTSAGNRALDSFCSARAIALTSTLRQIKRSQAGSLQMSVGLAFALQSIGSAEAAGLHFLDRRIHCGWSGTAEGAGLHDFLWHHGRDRSYHWSIELGFKFRSFDQIRLLESDPDIFRNNQFWRHDHRRQELGDNRAWSLLDLYRLRRSRPVGNEFGSGVMADQL